MPEPFIPPDFLNETEEEIHQRMMEMAPSNYDKSEGALFWNLTRPTAIEKAEMIQFVILRTIQLMFPQFAEGVYLNYHGRTKGIEQHPPVKASGMLTFHGEPETIIPAGTRVSTIATDTDTSITFETTEENIVGEDGVVKALVRALEPGPIGNVPANTITVLDKPINGIKTITNTEPITGGVPIEDEEEYRKRILDADRNKSLSGSVRDYIRWAKEVAGVGEVIVLPEWNGAGTVKVLIIDANGAPANLELIDRVQSYIAPDGRDGGGLAPIGALVTVSAPQQRVINISFKAELDEGADKAAILENLKQSITNYFYEVSIGGLVRYSIIGSIVINTKGIRDYDMLLLNETAENIQLESSELAVLGTVNIIDG